MCKANIELKGFSHIARPNLEKEPKDRRVRELIVDIVNAMRKLAKENPQDWMLHEWVNVNSLPRNELMRRYVYCRTIEMAAEIPENRYRMRLIDYLYTNGFITDEETGRLFAYVWDNAVLEIIPDFEKRVTSIYMPLWEKYGDRGDISELQKLPNEFKIYRGINNNTESGIRRYSWTLSRDIATFFATKEIKQRQINLEKGIKKYSIDQIRAMRGHFVTATIEKKYVTAYLTARNESEIVVADPSKIKNISVEEKCLDDFINPNYKPIHVS